MCLHLGCRQVCLRIRWWCCRGSRDHNRYSCDQRPNPHRTQPKTHHPDRRYRCFSWSSSAQPNGRLLDAQRPWARLSCLRYTGYRRDDCLRPSRSLRALRRPAQRTNHNRGRRSRGPCIVRAVGG